MRPANFPGRKNDRRIAALTRLAPPSKDTSLYEQMRHPFTILKSRVLPDDMARAIRTKKDRSARGRLRA